MRNILLIIDRRGWALETLAMQIKDKLGSTHRIEIFVESDEDFLIKFDRKQKYYDVIHFLANQAFFRWAEITTRPCVFTMHHVHNGWKLFDEKLPFADAYCVSSKQWYDELMLRYGFKEDELFRIFLGIDIERFSPKDETVHYKKKDKAICIGFSAVNTERKRVDKLWTCIERLKIEKEIPFTVYITGDYWNNTDIPNSVKENVVLLGRLQENEMPGFYKNLDYYLCTSESEGGPGPVMESMSAGVTVLTTAVGVVPEIVKSGTTGFILPDNCIEERFVQTIKETWLDDQRRIKIGINARKILAKHFDSTKTTQTSRYQNIYEAAIINFSKKPFFYRFNKHLTAWRRRLSLLVYQK